MENQTLPGSFDDLLKQADRPVLADFRADWCSACRSLEPVLKKIAAEYKDRLLTIRIDVDKRPALASRYEVSGIPTVILFRSGQPVMRFSGALPYDEFKRRLDQALR
jgi:thioredoxin 1